MANFDSKSLSSIVTLAQLQSWTLFTAQKSTVQHQASMSKPNPRPPSPVHYSVPSPLVRYLREQASGHQEIVTGLEMELYDPTVAFLSSIAASASATPSTPLASGGTPAFQDPQPCSPEPEPLNTSTSTGRARKTPVLVSSASDDEDEIPLSRRRCLPAAPAEPSTTVGRYHTRSRGLPSDAPASKKAKTTSKTKSLQHPAPSSSTKRPLTDASGAPPSKKLKQPEGVRLQQFIKANLVKGKLVNPDFFRLSPLSDFLEKLKKQGWADLFCESGLGCSGPDVAEFYSNCVVEHGYLLTTSVQGKSFTLEAKDIGNLLGIPATGEDWYVREDVDLLDQEEIRNVLDRTTNNRNLGSSVRVKKETLCPMHRLLFWFVLKNIIPRGQRRDAADLNDLWYIDLLDTGRPLNLPAIMIRHIARITSTTKPHDLGYGFFISLLLERSGLKLRKRENPSSTDFIGKQTLVSCGFPLDDIVRKPLAEHLANPSLSGEPAISRLSEHLKRIEDLLVAIQKAFEAERALNENRHLSIISAIQTQLQPFNPTP